MKNWKPLALSLLAAITLLNAFSIFGGVDTAPVVEKPVTAFVEDEYTVGPDLSSLGISYRLYLAGLDVDK